MQVTCHICERSINVPEEKLPENQVVHLTCPGCRGKIRIDQHIKAEPRNPEKSPEPEPKEDVSPELEAESPGLVIAEDFSDDEELVIYDEDDLVALILDEKHQDLWTKVLSEYNPKWGSINPALGQEKGYRVQYAKSPEHAVHKLRRTKYNLVALQEDYGRLALQKNPVYRFLLEMPMALRRNIFVALLGKNFHSLNNMEAFAYSVNVVINEKDLDQLHKILKKGISDNEAFYKVFKETLHAMGKS